jgi:hypothetical protein
MLPFWCVPLAFAGMLSACGTSDSPGLVACEQAIQATLKSPSSYKRIKAEGSDEYIWSIEYDAVNSYNAPLRGSGNCYFDAKSGHASWFKKPEIPDYTQGVSDAPSSGDGANGNTDIGGNVEIGGPASDL